MRNRTHTILLSSLALVAALSATRSAPAQDNKQPYVTMAPVEQYLMDRDAEIALARSAAPDSISREAAVLVLTRHGYETAVEGKNGWVCWVDAAGWPCSIIPNFGAQKFAPPSASIRRPLAPFLPYAYKRTEMLLAGRSKQEVIAAIKSAIDKKELPALEPGTVSYMMSKSSYLTDSGEHNVPHIMFFQSVKDGSDWGANLTNSPVAAVNYWYLSEQSYPQLKSFPSLSVFLVVVDKWSDGTSVAGTSGGRHEH